MAVKVWNLIKKTLADSARGGDAVYHLRLLVLDELPSVLKQMAS